MTTLHRILIYHCDWFCLEQENKTCQFLINVYFSIFYHYLWLFTMLPEDYESLHAAMFIALPSVDRVYFPSALTQTWSCFLSLFMDREQKWSCHVLVAMWHIITALPWLLSISQSQAIAVTIPGAWIIHKYTLQNHTLPTMFVHHYFWVAITPSAVCSLSILYNNYKETKTSTIFKFFARENVVIGWQ